MNIENIQITPIIDLGMFQSNHLWIKRDDLIPFSFGGNKARKAQLFFEEIDKGDYDCVVTYGSSSSNHCRVVANECSCRGIQCYIIQPEKSNKNSFNSQMMSLFDADITVAPISSVHETIENKISDLRCLGKKPYFIEGGGHGNIGTEAYVRCYHEIQLFERKEKVYFDYIFLASGTGTTQAGLICGKLLSSEKRTIIGISIARKNPKGREVVLDSIRSYLKDKAVEEEIQDATVFIDDYCDGYGIASNSVKETVYEIMKKFGIPMDNIYTGKAFYGLMQYTKGITGKNVLFIHTGGTPLFFDALCEYRNTY